MHFSVVVCWVAAVVMWDKDIGALYRTSQTCFCSDGMTSIDYLVAGGNQACLKEIRSECEQEKTPEHVRILERLAEMTSGQ